MKSQKGVVQTTSGLMFDILNPDPTLIKIQDVADSLAKLCRFGGHCTQFYSVAQHTCLVASKLPPHLMKWGLLHDASEAFLIDLPSPIKRLLPQYQEIENNLLKAVAERFDLVWPIPEEVKEADARALATEYRDLMLHTEPWLALEGIIPYPERIVPMPVESAKQYFLTHFELINKIIKD